MEPSPHEFVTQRCLNAECARAYGVREVLTACPACGELLDVVYRFERRGGAEGAAEHGALSGVLRRAAARSASVGGVWCFKELLPFYRALEAGVEGVGVEGMHRDPVRGFASDAFERRDARLATIGEGRTLLQQADDLASHLGFEPGALHLQYEGYNPTGSFKDNGMTAGFTHARMVGAKVVACASTGNTSASLGAYAARCGMRAFVFIGDGKIAFGKLSQALDYGATTLQVSGDFDTCLARVRAIAEDPANGVYLLNSVNPFRLEGQKTIMLRVLRDLMMSGTTGDGRTVRVPDWIVVPGGNLGNCSAFAKAFIELRALGLIDRVPRLAVINAAGARTLDRVYNELGVRWKPAADGCLGVWRGAGAEGVARCSLLGTYERAAVAAEFERMDRAGEKAHTVASAIEINRPVNLAKALRALWAMDGVVRSVSDETILEHKAMVGRFGMGCEPASGASVAGAAMLLREGVIRRGETVVCVLTGHQLKDPDVTVGYHTGIAASAGAKGGVSTGGEAGASSGERTAGARAFANAPVRVSDDVEEIKRAMGIG